MYQALNDPYFVILVLSCAAVVTIGAIVTALNRLPRADFAQLRNELNELAGRVKALESAEQRRFIRELKSPRERAETTYVNGGATAGADRPGDDSNEPAEKSRSTI
jgi:hypothetical protein